MQDAEHWLTRAESWKPSWLCSHDSTIINSRGWIREIHNHDGTVDGSPYYFVYHFNHRWYNRLWIRGTSDNLHGLISSSSYSIFIMDPLPIEREWDAVLMKVKKILLRCCQVAKWWKLRYIPISHNISRLQVVRAINHYKSKNTANKSTNHYFWGHSSNLNHLYLLLTCRDRNPWVGACGIDWSTPSNIQYSVHVTSCNIL